jgi:general secretion pathway protein K
MRCPRTVHGFALIAVLWTVAALGIIVGGIVSTQRQEVRWVTASRQVIEGRAIGQAVTYMLAKDILVGNKTLHYTRQYPVSFMGHVVQVEVMALDGLADINKTPKPLLTQMLTTIGALPPHEAEALAQQWVGQRDAVLSSGGWYNTAELMGLPAMQYDTFARLAPYVTAHSDTGAGLIDPLFAPPEMLNVLAKDHAEVAAQVLAARERGDVGIDTTRLEQAFIGTGGRKKVRFTARVHLGSHTYISTVTDLDLAGGATGQPWRVLQTSWAHQRSFNP